MCCWKNECTIHANEHLANSYNGNLNYANVVSLVLDMGLLMKLFRS